MNGQAVLLSTVLLLSLLPGSVSSTPSYAGQTVQAQRPASDQDCPAEAIERATCEIRKIAIAVEKFVIEAKSYPGPTTGVVRADFLKASLVPKFMKSLPSLDPWGSAYRYWSDGKDYLIISTGADGASAVNYGEVVRGKLPEFREKVCHGGYADESKDMILCDGQFCQWFWPESHDGS